MWKACLYTEERAELVQKMGEAPLVDGSLSFGALSICNAGKTGRRWRRWSAA